MQDSFEIVIHYLTTYGMNVIGAIIILILGKVGAGIARRIVTRLLRKSNTDASVISFVAGLAHAIVLVFAILAALARFGVQTTSFIAVLGAAGLAVGLALQGSLANFAAGFLLLVLRPFKTEDYIEAAGASGSVKEIHLFTTTLVTPDNIKIIVPNSKIFGDTIKNFTAYDIRRLDMVFGIGYGSSIGKAIEVLHNLIKKDPRILPEPAVQIAVAELADSSVNLVVRPWVKSADYWDVKFDFMQTVKEAFDQNGIEIPFPQRTIYMVKP